MDSVGGKVTIMIIDVRSIWLVNVKSEDCDKRDHWNKLREFQGPNGVCGRVEQPIGQLTYSRK
jgi:hypothetical protein